MRQRMCLPPVPAGGFLLYHIVNLDTNSPSVPPIFFSKPLFVLIIGLTL